MSNEVARVAVGGNDVALRSEQSADQIVAGEQADASFAIAQIRVACNVRPDVAGSC